MHGKTSWWQDDLEKLRKEQRPDLTPTELQVPLSEDPVPPPGTPQEKEEEEHVCIIEL
jgi:hypothetical protein